MTSREAIAGAGAGGGGGDPIATVREELIFQARLYRMPKADAVARVPGLTSQLDLAGSATGW